MGAPAPRQPHPEHQERAVTTAPPTERDEESRTPELLVITGMSGAGRTTTANALEDLGWFVVDNLPPQMLAPLAALAAKVGTSLPQLAVVVDVRGRSFFTEVREALSALRARGVRLRVLFLDASDEALVRRFESVRRPHPLQAEGRILDGIERERELVGDLRGTADLVVDTSDLNVHQLTAKILETFSDGGPTRLRVTVMSFGFKYGIPVDADHVVDVRFLPNPFWIPELRPLTGREEPVSEYVLQQPGAKVFVDRYVWALEPVMSGYEQENRAYVTIAIGCTGGKHRSVAMAEEIAAQLRARGVNAGSLHRDLGRE
ncbi:MAG: RNase adapter RapZ [Actinomycetes bacterium]